MGIMKLSVLLFFFGAAVAQRVIESSSFGHGQK